MGALNLTDKQVWYLQIANAMTQETETEVAGIEENLHESGPEIIFFSDWTSAVFIEPTIIILKPRNIQIQKRIKWLKLS